MDPSSRTWASATPLPTAPDDVLARRLVLLPRAALLLAPRRRGVPPAGGLALAATEGVVDRDVPQRKRVARTDLGVGARHQRIAHRDSLRRKDIALLAVGVMQQGDAGAPVRVVLDVRDFCRDPVLVPPEVDHPVPTLVAATL